MVESENNIKRVKLDNDSTLECTFIDEKIKQMKGGVENLVIICDFDYTITHRFVENGTVLNSSFGALETYHKFSQEMRDRMVGNLKKYSPKEYDLSIPYEERRRLMEEWTTKSCENVLNDGLKESYIPDIIDDNIKNKSMRLRKGVEKLFEFALNNKVPFYVLSAGCGNIVKEFLVKTIPCMTDLLKEDLVHIVSNEFYFDTNGKAVSYKKPILNTFSKVDVSIII